MLEAAGTLSLQTAVAIARKGGKIVVLGVFHEEVALDFRTGRSSHGVEASLWGSLDLPAPGFCCCHHLLAAGGVDRGRHITAEIPLRDIVSHGFIPLSAMRERILRFRCTLRYEVPVLKIPLPLPISESKRLPKKISQQARSALETGQEGRRWVLLILLVLGAVLGGYLMEGGEIGVLIQLAEIVIIMGAALGSVLISTPLKVVIQILQSLTKVLTGATTRRRNISSCSACCMSCSRWPARTDSWRSNRTSKTRKKVAFLQSIPVSLKITMRCIFSPDTVRVILAGGAPHDLEALMDTDIETHHEESAMPAAVLSKVGDAMPGLGIVAAVLGIVITMGAINGPPEEIGHKVGAALVGTFLGILVSYGFFSRLHGLENLSNNEARYILALKAGLSPLPVMPHRLSRWSLRAAPSFPTCAPILKKWKRRSGTRNEAVWQNYAVNQYRSLRRL